MYDYYVKGNFDVQYGIKDNEISKYFYLFMYYKEFSSIINVMIIIF